MPVKPPPKAPEAPPDKPAENKFDPFRPEMPQIPGVGPGVRKGAKGVGGLDTQRLMQIGGIAVAVLLIGAVIFWWMKSKSRGASDSSSPDADTAEKAAPTPPLPSSIPAVQEGPTVAGTVDELSAPWTAKKFTFANSLTHENIHAMVIRLPGGEFWAFSLQGPFGRCELEFVTDLGKLASQYKFKGSHPMVVNPCDSTVYDPLKVGSIGGNTWVRGEIVQGSGLRPPISIDVKVLGRLVVADSIE